MNTLPRTENPLLIRTDFSDKSAWEKLRKGVSKSYGRQRPSVEFMDDPAYDGMPKETILILASQGYPHNFIILADRTTLSLPDLPLLIVDLSNNPGSEFRAIPAEIFWIDVNLRLANMDFHEFADNVGPDGIFRGFPTPWHIKLLMKLAGGIFPKRW